MAAPQGYAIEGVRAADLTQDFCALRFFDAATVFPFGFFLVAFADFARKNGGAAIYERNARKNCKLEAKFAPLDGKFQLSFKVRLDADAIFLLS